MAALKLVTFTLLVGSSLAYMTFQSQIPNGNKVPHPCKANFMWPGVGHRNRLGGGVRNVFGQDFQNAGYWWSDEICWADSDGDGMTNGYELGDPDCIWSTGQVPTRSNNITHPGICDPHDSPQCSLKNSFVECTMDELDCPRINKTGVKHHDMVFLETTVPPTETNYYCMTFDLPADQDYHVIATEPIMDNMEVLHHILVYACEDDNATEILKPQSCGMEARGKCGSIIGLWSVGSPGICFGDGIGFRFGKTAFRRVKLEIHYNNPMEKEGMRDKSGLRFYYQPAKPEVQDLVTLTLGTNLLEIPPGEARVEVESICKGSCTRSMITKPAKIFAGLNHMHYRGREMMIELFRDGRKIADISRDRVYSYDSPTIHSHTPSLDLLPGDEIRTICVFNNLNSDRYVFYGEATVDEMCFGFLLVYPRDALRFPYCTTFGELDICDMFAGKPVQTSKGECNWGAFTHFDDYYSPPWTKEVKDNCRMDGMCRPQCRETVERMARDDPCMTKEASMIVNFRLASSEKGVSALARMNGCRGAIYAKGDSSHESDRTCGWEECSEYCNDGGGYGGSYDAAPKMTAGWMTCALAGLLLLKFYS